MCAHSSPNKGSKKDALPAERRVIICINVLLKLYFQDECLLYANWLFSILFFVKCIHFQFLTSWYNYAHSHINKSSKWKNKSREKQSYFAEKCFFNCIFRDQGHLYVNCLFYFLTIYQKSLLFQFLGSGVRMYIPILTGVQNGRISCRKNSHILLKDVFLSLFPEIKVTFIPVACFIFWLFTVKALFFGT